MLSMPFPVTSKHLPPTPSSNINGVTSSMIPSTSSTSTSMASSIGPTGAHPNWHSVFRIDGYDLDDFVTFTRYPDYDILDIQFGEMEAPT